MTDLATPKSIAQSESAASGDVKRAKISLLALNFFVADMQAGVGPFLGVFLQQNGWRVGSIGTVMTLGGIVGMIMSIPAGAFVDQTRWKRLTIVVTAICTVLASCLLLLTQSTIVVTASQVATAIAGAAIGPAIAGITLGIVRQKGFNAQNGLNQAWNHGGNVVGAGLSGYLGWRFGMPAVFLLAGVFGVFAIVATLAIPARTIDHLAARGLESSEKLDGTGRVEGFRKLLGDRHLLILAACLGFFHLANAAMLPLYGLAVVDGGKADPAIFTALTVVVAQSVMIIAALVAMRMVAKSGYWLVIFISFVSLPLRGALAGSFIEYWGVWPVQVLDGIGAGLQSVAVPGLIASMLSGTGRVNVGQGAVMTAQGLGASLSPALGGWLAEWLGYQLAFYILGSFAIISLLLWSGLRHNLRQMA